jgi:hypothetical protein
MRRACSTVVALSALVALSSCAGSSTPGPTGNSPATTETAGPTLTISPSPLQTLSPSPEPPPSPEPSPRLEPLGRSVAHLRSTGDVQADVALRLALSDGFMAVWCDTPNDCAKAAYSLQIMGEALGEPGRHRTRSGDVLVTIELEDRFLYSSTGDASIEGECVVTFTTSDERGFAGEIECQDITNGFGIGSSMVSVRGTFVATY